MARGRLTIPTSVPFLIVFTSFHLVSFVAIIFRLVFNPLHSFQTPSVVQVSQPPTRFSQQTTPVLDHNTLPQPFSTVIPYYLAFSANITHLRASPCVLVK